MAGQPAFCGRVTYLPQVIWPTVELYAQVQDAPVWARDGAKTRVSYKLSPLLHSGEIVTRHVAVPAPQS